eukprot:3459021-Rhodomonas_salina.1
MESLSMGWSFKLPLQVLLLCCPPLHTALILLDRRQSLPTDNVVESDSLCPESLRLRIASTSLPSGLSALDSRETVTGA